MNLMLPEMRDEYNLQEWWCQREWFFLAINHFNLEIQLLGVWLPTPPPAERMSLACWVWTSTHWELEVTSISFYSQDIWHKSLSQMWFCHVTTVEPISSAHWKLGAHSSTEDSPLQTLRVNGEGSAFPSSPSLLTWTWWCWMISNAPASIALAIHLSQW